MAVNVVTGVPGDATAEFERHRKALTGYCYRMLGSSFEAEDAVQETMLRAWRAADRFEGRSAVKSWLYRIATNVCLDMLDGRKRRARPVDLGPASTVEGAKLDVLPDHEWLEPMPDARVAEDGDPADVVEARDTLRLAFVGALQHLPPKQRAVLILREVLRWRAAEVAELLDTSVASVNSALQRARAAIDGSDLVADEAPARMDGDEQQALLDRYVAAFEDYDLDALVQLLHEDAMMSMPPFELWLQGRDSFIGWLVGPGAECRGSRLLPAGTANGSPAFGQYRVDPEGGHKAWALQVLELRDGRVTGLCSFLDVGRMFPLFGLPLRLGDE